MTKTKQQELHSNDCGMQAHKRTNALFKAAFLTLFICLFSCSHLVFAQTPTPAEQKEKTWVANHIPDDPDIDRIGMDLEFCSDYVGRKLQRTDWITDAEFERAWLTPPATSALTIIDICAFFMPKSMQIKWVKEQMRLNYRHVKSTGKGSLSTRSDCAKLMGKRMIPNGFLTDTQFETLLRNTKPQRSIYPCHDFVTESQYDRLLDHEALYLLNYAPRYHRLRDYTRGWY